MSKLKLKLEENIEGQFFVDSNCVDCGLAESLILLTLERQGNAFVKKQPQNSVEELNAEQALVACPTGSIVTVTNLDLNTAQ
jgi:hypothetical protein